MQWGVGSAQGGRHVKDAKKGHFIYNQSTVHFQQKFGHPVKLPITDKCLLIGNLQ